MDEGKKDKKEYKDYYRRQEEQQPNLNTLAKMADIQRWIIEHQKIPTVKEAMEITGYKFDYAAQVRRKALREFPRASIEELAEEVVFQLMERAKIGNIETPDLIKLMPWVAEQKGSKSDIKQEITHRFIVLKPDEKIEEE